MQTTTTRSFRSPTSTPAATGECVGVRPGAAGQPEEARTALRTEVDDVPTATRFGQAGLQGWREKVADRLAEPLSNRTPLDEDQVRALVGSAFFVLAVMYVVKTLRAVKAQA